MQAPSTKELITESTEEIRNPPEINEYPVIDTRPSDIGIQELNENREKITTEISGQVIIC